MSLGRLAAAVAGIVATAWLTGCDPGSAGEGASPTPAVTAPASTLPGTATVGQLPSVLEPPPGPIAPADQSEAALALAAAGRRTAEAGSLRMKLSAHVGATGSSRHLDVSATGEAESATRSVVHALIDLSGRHLNTDSATYDGRSFSRNEGEAWHVVAAAGSQSPQGYTNFVAHASGVVNGGPGIRNGVAAERYDASVAAPRVGNRPAVAPSPGAGNTVQLVAWVERGGGHLVGLDLVFPDIGAGHGTMTIDFSDFGAAIKVAPPVLTP